MYLVYSKNCFSFAKMFVLRLFEMVENQKQCSKLEQRSVVKFLLAEKYKPCKIYRRMRDVHGEVCLNQKDVYKSSKLGFATTSQS